MTARLVALCFNASDPLDLARFWAEALSWEIEDEAAVEVALLPTDGTRFRIVFLPAPTEKVEKNRLHLDLTTRSIDDQAEMFRRLLSRGARHVDIGQGPDEEHVLADPEDNELCIIEPENTFLAGCGRLGSITCDGSPATGYFWSGALGWPLVWDQDDETAIRAPDGTGPFITWGKPVLPKVMKNRLHLHLAPANDTDLQAEVARLVALGATPVATRHSDVDRVVLTDPDGNELCVQARRVDA